MTATLTESQARAVIEAAGCKLVVVPYRPELRNDTHVALVRSGVIVGSGADLVACAASLLDYARYHAEERRKAASHFRERAAETEARAVQAEKLRAAVEAAAGGTP